MLFVAVVFAEQVTWTTIQDGIIYDSNGNIITVGYDQYGYNYQAHIFNGYYGNYSRPDVPVDSGSKLQMKWNDAWLANTDRDGDGKLDRHYGYDSYRGSGAWLTNHEAGIDENGQKYTYFVKIIAAPLDATLTDGIWYNADGTELGPVIWGEFAIVQEVMSGAGAIYCSPSGPGLGGGH